MADSNKLVSLNSILNFIREHLIYYADNAQRGTVYSNDTGNTWGVIAHNESTNKRYYLKAKNNSISFAERDGAYSGGTIDNKWTLRLNENVGSYLNLNGGTVTVTNTPAADADTNHFTTELMSITLQPGLWLINASVPFYKNANGIRGICLSSTSGTGSHNANGLLDIRPASGGTSYTTCSFTSLLTVTSANAILYLNAFQSSGASLNAYPRVKAYCISA